MAEDNITREIDRIPHEPAEDFEIENYARGVTQGIMKHATPNLVGSLLARIRNDAERWPSAAYLECAMCGAAGVFVISPNDPSEGYCFAENQLWTIRGK